MKTFEIKFEGDPLSPYDLIINLDEILKDYGIRLEVDEKEEHDGFDICIVKIEDNGRLE